MHALNAVHGLEVDTASVDASDQIEHDEIVVLENEYDEAVAW